MRPSICVLLGTLKPPAIDKVDLGWERPRNGRRSSLRKRGGIVARGTGYTALSPGKVLTDYAGRRSSVKMLVCRRLSAGTPPTLAVLGDQLGARNGPTRRSGRGSQARTREIALSVEQ